MGIQHKIGLDITHWKCWCFPHHRMGLQPSNSKNAGIPDDILGTYEATTKQPCQNWGIRREITALWICFFFFCVCVYGIVISSGFGHLWCQCNGWHTIQSHFRGWHIPTQGPRIGSFSFYGCWIPIKQKHVEWTNII